VIDAASLELAAWLSVGAVGALAAWMLVWTAACRGGRFAERRVARWHEGGDRW